MKFRSVFLVLLIVFAFWYFTTHYTVRRAALPGGGSSQITLTEAHAAPEYDVEELSNISVYRKAMPSVVNITSTTVGLDFFYGFVPQQGQGSGFILDRQGHILTNYHVIADAQNIEVQTWDKRRYKARIIGRDRSHDLALLQIDGQNLTPAVLASSRSLVVGQKVYAIGNPFGLSGTMTTGIISAIRSIHGPEGAPIENAIQTDAAINPGNSGGPLLNSHGEVIGINSLIATNPNQQVDQSAGIGFAIPIDTAKAVLGDFQKYGRVRRPSLGIVSLPIGPDLAEQIGLPANYGVLIQQTVQGGAAARAGLHGGNKVAYLGNMQIYLGGDLIVGIDGQNVTSTQDISEIMDRHQAGDTVTVTFFRGQRKMTAQVTLGEAHDQQV
ncbi:S1C family serine protease [Paracidobacterium acidisoli]|uniref:PDZ domain-containing protein n=1 Tax=Paracidobacterium acidisoli TaxID=2303751 RepID=A0A372IN95_9BACT|nr:trypsin-like peptidase domain-containing protein [Paracidobacterium acidisoli]MBT9332104.1 trypsin-like peptidase domain-containing protein [Paracidobacterium acidisoli]